MLSLLYRLLLRLRRQDEMTYDMLGAFEEARVDARRRGLRRYFTFGIREICGLLIARGLPWGRLAPIAGIGLAGFVFGFAWGLLWPPSYTSVGALEMRPSQVPASLRPDLIDEGPDIHAMSNQILSRTVLTTIISNYDLYPATRQSKPLEDVVDEMRDAIRIEYRDRDETAFDIAFTYGEGWDLSGQARYDAQRVVYELMTRFIDENIRERTNRTFQTRDFLEDQTTDAGQRWEDLSAALSKLDPSDPSYDRVALDVELAREQYVTYSKRLSDALVSEELEGREQGPQLRALDAASLPGEPDLSPRETAVTGLMAGLLAGALLVLWRAIAALWPERLRPAPSTDA